MTLRHVVIFNLAVMLLLGVDYFLSNHNEMSTSDIGWLAASMSLMVSIGVFLLVRDIRSP